MMNFRIVNSAIQTLLGDAAAGRFRVIGFQGQGQDALEIKNNKRAVQTFYSSGTFKPSAGRTTGSTMHDMTFNISMSCSSAARADLAVINNPNATSAQIASAMTALAEGAYEVDLIMDELFEIVYQILMDALNIDLGLSEGVVIGRWVESITKDEPIPQGSLVVLTGTMMFSCRCVEAVTGDTPVPLEIILNRLDLAGDDVEQTGLDVSYT